MLKFLQLCFRSSVFYVADIRQIFSEKGLSIRCSRRVLREKIVQLGAEEWCILSDHPSYARSGTNRYVRNELNVRKNAFPKLRFWLIDNRVLYQARLKHLQNILVLEILWGVVNFKRRLAGAHQFFIQCCEALKIAGAGPNKHLFAGKLFFRAYRGGILRCNKNLSDVPN